MKVFAFEFTDSIHESAYAIIPPLHMTKKGAYKAMRKFIDAKWNEERNFPLGGMIRARPLEYSRWRIQPYDVED